MKKSIFYLGLVTSIHCSSKIYIKPIQTKWVTFSANCSALEQLLEQHFYLNTKDTLVLMNNAVFNFNDYRVCVQELNRQDFIRLFGTPIYTDSMAFYYKVIKNEEQKMAYNTHGNKIYNDGYVTLIIFFKGDKADGWSIGKYHGLN